MKRKLVELTVALGLAGLSAVSCAAQNAPQSGSTAASAHWQPATLVSRNEVPYSASITVTDLGQGKVGYAINLSSATCHNTLTGTAAFFSKTDDAGDDSSFLTDGTPINTNVFKDAKRSDNIVVTIQLDVSSKPPRYAGVDLANAPVGSGGCITDKSAGWNFYKWKK